jgi:hypothetical protein
VIEQNEGSAHPRTILPAGYERLRGLLVAAVIGRTVRAVMRRELSARPPGYGAHVLCGSRLAVGDRTAGYV